MRVAGLVKRLPLLALAALSLAACAQNREEVQVGVGMQIPASAKARDYAALYAPYAMMATAAYTNDYGLNGQQCPDAGKLSRPRPGESADDATFRNNVRGWIASLHSQGWQCRFGIVGNLECPQMAGGKKCKPVGGLEFHVWRRMQDGQCREVAIAFRGTDKNDSGDWISNFRWLYRLAPKFDQYYQVQTHIKQIVAQIKSQGCGGAGTQFVSAGHSLGGGLAQQAAYADDSRSIKYVYAFDPSPVTGFFDVSAMVREKSTDGLGVDRAYEAGEILTLPRLLIENIYPPQPCNPRIRSVRFNVLSGLPVAQHSIAGLTEELRKTAKEAGANARRVEASAAARACRGEPQIQFPLPIPFLVPPPA